MAMPLLTTKLYVPPPLPSLVERPRLIERLNEGPRSGRKLTLISAPAGFGKTTLVSEWVHAMGRVSPPIAIAWLSLDESDNDPTRFLAYFVAALQTTEADIGKGASLQAGTGFRLTDDSISGRHVMQVICKQDGQPFVT
jgi:LuxR family maltose regulon positive regulatory protein